MRLSLYGQLIKLLDKRLTLRGSMVEDFCDLVRLIRSLQRLEGHPDCFGTAEQFCGRTECAWREYCLKRMVGRCPLLKGILKKSAVVRMKSLLHFLRRDSEASLIMEKEQTLGTKSTRRSSAAI